MFLFITCNDNDTKLVNFRNYIKEVSLSYYGTYSIPYINIIHTILWNLSYRLVNL